MRKYKKAAYTPKKINIDRFILWWRCFVIVTYYELGNIISKCDCLFQDAKEGTWKDKVSTKIVPIWYPCYHSLMMKSYRISDKHQISIRWTMPK